MHLLVSKFLLDWIKIILTFKFVPPLDPRRRNVANIDVQAPEEVILTPDPGRLGHLLEVPAQSSHALHLVQLLDGVQNGCFVVVIPANRKRKG